MNKIQKRNQVKARRFHQKICKMTYNILIADTNKNVDGPVHFEPNLALIKKFTMKELEYVMNMDFMDAEGYNEHLRNALHSEYVERKLLLENTKAN